MIGSILVAAWLAIAPLDPGDDAAALADYNARRAEIPDTADAHWKLGLWAEQKGLKGEATVEFLAVARLDPTRDAAWKKLGFEKRDGRWVSSEQIAAEKLDAETQRKADAKWLPILKKAKSMLGQKGRQAEADATLFEIKDPRAIPSIWKIFGQGTPEDQERAIDILGRIDDEAASKALAGLAIFGKTDLVRRVAVETLTRRNPNDVLMLWVGLLDKPVKYEVRQVAGPGSPGYLTVEGEKFNVRRSYYPPTMSETQAAFVNDPTVRGHWPLAFNSKNATGPPPGSKPVGFDQLHGELYIYDYHWAPAWSTAKKTPDPSAKYQSFERSQTQAKVDRDFEIEETAKMAAGAQAQLQQDVNTIEAGNAVTRELNARLAEALRRVSGKDFGDDKEAWLKWYMERRGYKYIAPADRTKPTIEVQVPLPYVPQSGPPILGEGASAGGGPGYCMIWEHDKGSRPKTNKCFVAGTMILTPEGPRPIESLEAGDLVLTSDGPPGLATHPGRIAAVHHSRAERTVGLTISGETGVTAISWVEHVFNPPPQPSPTRGEGVKHERIALFSDPLPPRGGGLGWGGRVAPGETVVTTEGHPLWKPGRGWVAAGDLMPGDRVATRRGSAVVEAIEVRPGAEVWNLEIADGATYQVGQIGVIAHDLAPIEEIMGGLTTNDR